MISSLTLLRRGVTTTSIWGSRANTRLGWASWRNCSSVSNTFSLKSTFVKGYECRPNPFGFNGLGEVVYLRTYSRQINENEREKWFQTVERVNLMVV